MKWRNNEQVGTSGKGTSRRGFPPRRRRRQPNTGPEATQAVVPSLGGFTCLPRRHLVVLRRRGTATLRVRPGRPPDSSRLWGPFFEEIMGEENLSAQEAQEDAHARVS